MNTKQKLLASILCIIPAVAIITGALMQGSAGFFLGCSLMITLVVLVKMVTGIKCETNMYLTFMAVVWTFGWAFSNWTWRSFLSTAIAVITILYLLPKQNRPPTHANQ